MKKGEVWSVEIPHTDGREQSGTRPVILLTTPQVNVVIVVPLTANLQALRFPYTIEIKPSKENGLKSISIALAFQVRALDKKRLKKRIGFVATSIKNDLDSMLKRLLKIS